MIAGRFHHLLAFCYCILAVCGPGLVLRAGADVPSNLETFGYDRSREGVARCLNEIVWTPEREAQFEQWLVELESDDFGTREQATVSLMRMPSLPHDRLQLAVDDARASVEKRSRMLKILDYNTPLRLEKLLYLAADAILTENLRGLAYELVFASNAVPVTQRTVWDAVRMAMLQSVEAGDSETLRDALKMTEATARTIASEGLAKIEGKNAIPSLLPLLADSDPRVRFHAALTVQSLGSPECIPAFISLLDAALPEQYQRYDTHIRFNSVEMLKKLTGQRFGYRAGYTPDVRRKYIDQWKAWYEEDGASVTIPFKGARMDRFPSLPLKSKLVDILIVSKQK